MTRKILIHIVPALRPQIDGAGEYALNLALALRELHGTQSRFIVCDPDRDGPASVENFPAARLRVRSEACIWSLLARAKEEQATVLLHYCPYGYHRMGLPYWLYRGIRSWIEERSGTCLPDGRQLCTLFYDAGFLSLEQWSKAYCLSLVQRWLSQEIHRFPGFSVTASRPMQRFLDGIEPQKTLLLPTLRAGPAGFESNPDWTQLASQFQERLFRLPSRSGVGATLLNAAETINPSDSPAYQSNHQSMDGQVRIRPRAA